MAIFLDVPPKKGIPLLSRPLRFNNGAIVPYLLEVDWVSGLDGLDIQNSINWGAVSRICLFFHPDAWGFMIQLDDRAYFSNGLDSTTN